MKVFMVFGIMLMLAAGNVQASTITLKDGRTVTGDIIQQDNTKVILKDGNTSLTYYKDEIVSIESDADKEELVEQYLSLFPTRDLISDWVDIKFYQDQKKVILPYLEQEQRIKALTEMRRQGLMKYLSSADLKVGISFYTSPEGKQFRKDMRLNLLDTMNHVYALMWHQATAALKSAHNQLDGQ